MHSTKCWNVKNLGKFKSYLTLCAVDLSETPPKKQFLVEGLSLVCEQ